MKTGRRKIKYLSKDIQVSIVRIIGKINFGCIRLNLMMAE